MFFNSKSLHVYFFLPPGLSTSQDFKKHNKQIKHLWDPGANHQQFILAIKSGFSFKEASVQTAQMRLIVFQTWNYELVKQTPKPKLSELSLNITTWITLTLKIVQLMASKVTLTEGF